MHSAPVEYHQDSVLTFSLLAIPAGPTTLLLTPGEFLPHLLHSLFLSCWDWDASWLAPFLLRATLATPTGGRWSHPSESRSQNAAVRLTPSDLPFPSLPVAWLLLPPGSHHDQLPMCCCDLNSGSRKKLTIPRLVAHCAEPPHQLESSSLLHPDAQFACQEHAWCFVKPYH